MAEIFEIEDIPLGAATSGNEPAKNNDKNGNGADKHLPSFDFDGYPNLNADDPDNIMSPRSNVGIEEVWMRYEKQSQDEGGASSLRHDPGLLERTI